MSPTKLTILGAAAFALLAAPTAWAEPSEQTAGLPVPGQATAGEPIAQAAPAEPSADGQAAVEPSAEAPAEPVAEADAEPSEPIAAVEEAAGDGAVPADAAERPELAESSADETAAAEAAPAAAADETAVDEETAALPMDADAAVEAIPEIDAVPVEEPVAAIEPAPLGAVGYDSQGREGRIHVVVRGDTLWDISEAYLGTPWVWPSIWQDNADIPNPHVIYPGDHIWITPNEMRRVSPEEAAQLLGNVPAAAEPELPVALEEETPAELPPAVPSAPQERGSVLVSAIENVGLITPTQLAAAASLVGRVPERILLSQEDQVYIGLGESDTEAGDQYSIFRTHEKVFDPDTGALLGYHVEMLGWLEVDETFPETSMATIRMSTGELELEDRLIPREQIPQEIAVQESPQGIEGKITFFPQKRVLLGTYDFVYLNRGSLDGLEVGSPLEVYLPGHTAEEVSRAERVDVPDRVIAKLLVVRAETEASVALVQSTKQELKLGDRFRGAGM